MSAPTRKEIEALSSPLGFAKGILGLDCYSWAEKILLDLDSPGAVAVRACNGAGKTTRLAAPAALWHASVFPNSLTICTAGVFRQVKDILFPAIKSHSFKFRDWEFLDSEIAAHNGSRILGFSTDDPGKFEGWHATNLLLIVDEAKSIPDTIFESIERCQPRRLLLLSSPGGPSGHFYDAFHGRRKFFRTHTVTAFECPHISRAWIAEQVEKYGEQHPLVRSMVFAEFMTSDYDGAVIPLVHIEACLQHPPARSDAGGVSAFCDFAAGGDENALAIRRGNQVELTAVWRERDTAKTIGRFIQLFREQNLAPSQISADAGGLGIPILDRLAEEGWPLIRVNNGSPAIDERNYANRGAEIWFTGAARIEKRELILPNDPALIAQLSSRRGFPNSRGRLELESKADMRARGLPSPDRADAVLGCIAQSTRKLFLGFGDSSIELEIAAPGTPAKILLA